MTLIDEFFDACYDGDVETVRKLLPDVNIESIDKKGLTAFLIVSLVELENDVDYSGSRYLLQLVLGVRAQSSRKLRDGLGTARCSNGIGRPAPISSSPQQGGLDIAAMTPRDLVATCIFTSQAA